MGFHRPGWQVPVETGAGDAGLLHNLAHRVPLVAQVFCVSKFVWVHDTGPAHPFSLRLGHCPGMGCTLDGVGAFHLSEQREDHHR
ncbi:hypothetical protein CDES_14525 (plasmid) [Corynebacterium deserti GIMN1.010]|uniref:Uncharacterized protein n=1 Tax=Corynebacterium deserti GIMN1.010 TaxID=931089 RepID=A0A0M4CSB5_9CORY|nr:hypothetical protein CDES_14525 [Corynebacterium deserti GIMN1.010]